MIQRYTNPNVPAYRNYGGRGIKVCRRWRTFTNFLADMGERPVGLSLERKRVNGNYTPSNCHWADRKRQARNRRNNKLTAAKAEDIRRRRKPGSGNALAREYGVSKTMIRHIVRGDHLMFKFIFSLAVICLGTAAALAFGLSDYVWAKDYPWFIVAGTMLAILAVIAGSIEADDQ